MGKIQKRSPCNIHSSCLVCFMNEKQLSVRWERGRCSYQRETFFFFLIEKLHLESPWLCLLQRLLIVTIYSGHDKVLTHSPFGEPSTLNSCVSFFCPQWDSPQPKPMWSMLSWWPLQCKYYCLFSNLLFVGCWKELAAYAEVATLVFDFVSTNL